MTGKIKRKENARLFADALLEAFERKYDEALADASEITLPANVGISFEHVYARFRSYRRRKTAMLVAAVLAALMLCGCTAYVYREQIANFLLEYSPVCIDTIPDNTLTKLDPAPCYGLSYVPEGYELVDQTSRYGSASYIWQNQNSEKILFYQSSPYRLHSYDWEHTTVQNIQHNQIDIVCFQVNGKYKAYLFKLEGYDFALLVNEKLPETEVLKMIDSLETKEFQIKL